MTDTFPNKESAALPPDEIHVWLSFYDRAVEPQLRMVCRELLNPAEREQESRFHFVEDRLQYLFSRALLRKTLSCYAPVAPADWIFSSNAYGRPEIANDEARQLSLSFNLSHTRGLIALGVTRQRVLGVDVENISCRNVSMDLANSNFATGEIAALKGTPDHLQTYRFFEYWTFKEAYIKARGMGLSLPLDKFSFHFPDERKVALSIQPDLADDPARWQFWQFRPTPDHLMAVCAEVSVASVSVPVIRVSQPPGGANAAAVLLRSSLAGRLDGNDSGRHPGETGHR